MIHTPVVLLEGMMLSLGKVAEAASDDLVSVLESQPADSIYERDLIEHLLRVALELGPGQKAAVPILAVQHKQLVNSVLSKALERAPNRLLPGAKMIRSGRPITDIMKKFKKIQRRALKGSMIGFRKSMKSNQKALINSARDSARSAYH